MELAPFRTAKRLGPGEAEGNTQAEQSDRIVPHGICVCAIIDIDRTDSSPPFRAVGNQLELPMFADRGWMRAKRFKMEPVHPTSHGTARQLCLMVETL